ncbi:MAG TPA: 4-hydroxy-3-methylbut-2-enyl diphosphate reductase [Miltoncostaeaceae bacterium]|nr:4-hydroxy-3-methylbut-2-enyl diphosphate reductase [Miltoncostaeaceae bacterium]
MSQELDLVAPRGYCAGVDRAIATVERVLEQEGAPVYVRGEIVHNKHVVSSLRAKGAIFVASESEVPEGETIILSAHGVAPEVRRVCEERNLRVIDATCPLVSKVHAEVRRYVARDLTVLLVGHTDHDEVIGTRGEAPEHVIVVQDLEDARTVQVPDPERVALTTQTTLSIDDTAEIVAELERRFPALRMPASSDICYATQGRQDAVRNAVTNGADLVLVVGSKNSSNSNRMVEVAEAAGLIGHLIYDASEMDPAWFTGVKRVALTAGASAPEVLVREVAEALVARGYVRGGENRQSSEGVVFALPRELRP